VNFKEILLYKPNDGRFFSFYLPAGRFALRRTSVSPLCINQNQLEMFIYVINGIISLIQLSPTSRLKCLVCNFQFHKKRPAQPIRPVRPWPNLFSDSIRFSTKKRGHTAADRNWKDQNNCSLLYFTNSPPTAVVSIVHAWMLNAELETGLEIYKRRSFEAWTRRRLMLPLLKPHCRCLQRVGY